MNLLRTTLALTLLIVVACGAETEGDSDPNNGGRTHWLRACEKDSECGTLHCVAQVCTEPCDRNADCRDVDESAACGEVAAGQTACVPECDPDSDCADLGAGFSCADGVCAVTASVAEPEPMAESSSVPEPTSAAEPTSAIEPGSGPRPTSTPEPSPSSEPGTQPDAGGLPEPATNPPEPTMAPTASPDAGTSCNDLTDLEATYDAAYSAVRGCEVDADCVAVGGEAALPCRCQVFVAADADLSELQSLVAQAAPCVEDCQCGDAPSEAPRCIEGMCSGPDDAPALCEETGGTWRSDACAPFSCGVPGRCAELVPGCDCGRSMNFDDALGCQPDVRCEATAEASCEASGGTWEASSCGDYQCGEPPICAAFVPGCNCGPAWNFLDGACAVDPACGEEAEQTVCEATGGVWDPASCGHKVCGQILCRAIIPGCDCGPEGVFTGFGCEVDPSCTAP